MALNKNVLRRVWEKFLENLWGQIDQERSAEIERALGFDLLKDQLWVALDNSEQSAAGWFYPINIYVGDDGSSLFSIVTQNGKLWQVGMKVENNALSLGEWVEVTEVFQPTQQSTLVIRELPDGRHRWMGVVATSVLNRVAEIDSTDLFDSFIEYWQDTGEAPRLDYYHMGDSDPEAWEFGTADYLAREGCCYIASGLFDEDHPLAKATIRAYERDPEGTWGWSIEFYAHAEPEILVLEPKVQVPVYKRGKNTRISVVKEVDAAGLFTRVGISQEKSRMASREIENKLKELFGEDEAGILSFLENVDTVNRTIKDEKIIHRDKKTQGRKPAEPLPEPEDDPDAEPEDDEEDEEEEGSSEVILDDEAVAQIAKHLEESPTMKALQQAITQLTENVGKLASAKEEDAKEIARLKKVNAKVTERLEQVEKSEEEKQQTWKEDLPRKRKMQASYRATDSRKGDEDDEEGFDEIAAKTLQTIPNSY